MAKKRKKQEEAKAEKDWKPPAFDREEFMRTEINVAKGTIYAAVLAVPMAAAAMYTLPVGGAAGGLLIGIAGISFMLFLLPMLKVDIKSFKVTHWLGVISTYFFLFLAVWVMLCNPPFNDFASPAIVEGQVSFDGLTWTNITVSGTGGLEVKMPANITTNTTMTIRVAVTDNKQLDTGSVMIDPDSGGPVPMTPAGGDYYEYMVANPQAQMFFRITASDTSGNDPAVYEFRLV